MTFKQAYEKLHKIADGKYNSLQYKFTTYEDGNIDIECCVYIDGYSHYSGVTWEQAFEKLNNALNPLVLTVADIDPVEM